MRVVGTKGKLEFHNDLKRVDRTDEVLAFVGRAYLCFTIQGNGLHSEHLGDICLYLAFTCWTCLSLLNDNTVTFEETFNSGGVLGAT